MKKIVRFCVVVSNELFAQSGGMVFPKLVIILFNKYCTVYFSLIWGCFRDFRGI